MVLRMSPAEFFARDQQEDVQRPVYRYVRYPAGNTGNSTYNGFNEDKAFKYIIIIGVTILAVAALKYIFEGD